MRQIAIQDALKSEAGITEFVTAFLDRSLDPGSFGHKAHCLVTAYLVINRPFDQVEAELPRLIKAYNLAAGGSNTDHEGYHHTITIFYLRTIREFLNSQPPESGLAERCIALLESPVAEKSYIKNFYAEDVLRSVHARREWVEPVLQQDRCPFHR